MLQFIYHLIFILINPQYFNNIEQKNMLKIQFNTEFKAKDYNAAKITFEKIEDLSSLIEPELRLDAGHVYYHLNDSLNARLNYESAVNNPNEFQSAVALNQLANIAVSIGDSAKALQLYKRAISRKYDFKIARFNYEIIKAKYKPKTSPPPPQQEDQQTQSEIEISEEKVDVLDQYTSKNISKERALQLLEDLNGSEKKLLFNQKNSNNKNTKDW